MKRFRLIAVGLALLIVLLMSGCQLTLDFSEGIKMPDANPENPGHVCVFEEHSVIDATCTAPGKRITKCSCGKEKETVIPVAAHTAAVVPEIAPTCKDEGRTAGSACSVCGEVLLAGEPIPRTNEHTAVTDPAIPATDKSPALSEGSHCSVCDKILVRREFVFETDYATPENYDGDYAYRALLLLEGGEAMAEFYNDIDAMADLFHSNGEDAGEGGFVASLDFGAYGLDSSAALATYAAYKMDRPLYYWLPTSISYTSTSLTVSVSDLYASGEERNAYNDELYSVAEELIGNAVSDKNYGVALSFHDGIIAMANYAYKSDGTTPSDEEWAHNVLGVLTLGRGVCESYAKAYQMLLNFCDIENIYVVGDAGGAHAWNLVCLDDGNYYSVDLTWDDTPEFFLGVSHTYFAVNDRQTLLDSGDMTFTDTHTPSVKIDTGIDFFYELPERSNSSFSGSGLMIRDTFTVDNMTFALVGDGAVQLTKIEKTGAVTVPASVEHQGVSYEVVSIGIIAPDGSLGAGSVAYVSSGYSQTLYEISSISIPATVAFIWDNALSIAALTEIDVAEDNAHFSDIDGVLYTKDAYTLIRYPAAKAGAEFTIPDGVRVIAYGAFSAFYSNDTITLSKLTLGKDVVLSGVANYGYGYPTLDSEIRESSKTQGSFVKILSSLSGAAELLIGENAAYATDGTALYSADGATLFAIFDSSATTFELLATVTAIDGAEAIFDSCKSLSAITVADGNTVFYADGGILYETESGKTVYTP